MYSENGEGHTMPTVLNKRQLRDVPDPPPPSDFSVDDDNTPTQLLTEAVIQVCRRTQCSDLSTAAFVGLVLTQLHILCV